MPQVLPDARALNHPIWASGIMASFSFADRLLQLTTRSPESSKFVSVGFSQWRQRCPPLPGPKMFKTTSESLNLG